MRKIYFFMGVMGSGKSTYASLLPKMFPNEKWNFVDFKTALTEYVSKFCGYDITKNYDSFKQNVFGIDDIKVSDELKSRFPNILTGRDLLQKIGTELFRNYDKEFWVNEFDKRINSLDGNIACCDCRFENELRYALTLINKFDVHFIFCNYPSDRYSLSNHASEIMAQKMLKYIEPRKEKFSTFYDEHAYILEHNTAGMFIF